MNRIADIGSNTVVIFLAKSANLALGLCFTVIVARTLGDELFGLFSFALVFVYFFSILPDLGIHPIVVRELVKNNFDSSILFGNAVYLKLVLTLVSILLLVMTLSVTNFTREQNSITLVLSGVLFFSSKISGLRRLLEAPYQANIRMYLPSALQVMDTLLALVALIFVIHWRKDLLLVSLVYVMASIPSFVWQWVNTVRLIKPKWKFHRQVFMALLKECWPLAIYVAGVTIYGNFDILLIKSLMTDRDVGVYAAAYRLFTPLSFLPFAIVASIFPIMSSYSVDEPEKLKRVFGTGLKIMAFIGTLITLVFVIWRSEIISTLFGTQYLQSIVPFAILACSTSFLFINFFLVDFNTANDNQRLNQIVVIIAVVLNIVLNIVLIPSWGIIGASISRLTTFVGSVILLTFFTSEFYDRVLRNRMLLLLFMGMLSVLLSLFMDMSPLIMSFVILPCYVTAVFLLNIFGSDEITFLQRQLRLPAFLRS